MGQYFSFRSSGCRETDRPTTDVDVPMTENMGVPQNIIMMSMFEQEGNVPVDNNDVPTTTTTTTTTNTTIGVPSVYSMPDGQLNRRVKRRQRRARARARARAEARSKIKVTMLDSDLDELRYRTLRQRVQ